MFSNIGLLSAAQSPESADDTVLDRNYSLIHDALLFADGHGPSVFSPRTRTLTTFASRLFLSRENISSSSALLLATRHTLSRVFLQAATSEAFRYAKYSPDDLQDWFLTKQLLVKTNESYAVEVGNPSPVYTYLVLSAEPLDYGWVEKGNTVFCVALAKGGQGIPQASSRPPVGNENHWEVDEGFISASLYHESTQTRSRRTIVEAIPRESEISAAPPEMPSKIYASPRFLSSVGLFVGDWVKTVLLLFLSSHLRSFQAFISTPTGGRLRLVRCGVWQQEGYVVQMSDRLWNF